MRVSLSALFSAFFLLSSMLTFAQSVEPCGAEPLHIAEMNASPAYARNFDAVRTAVQRLQASSNRNLEVYTLPVVVHIIHRGSPIGVEENISDEQIFSAIEGMNKDFRKEAGSLGDGNGVDTYIQFQLAKRTPDGEPTNGIVRVNGNGVPGFQEHGIASETDKPGANQSELKSITTWYGDDYINIFVVPEIDGNDGGWGVQGFAFLNPTGDARDGITVIYNTFGTVGELKYGRELNRTVVHEMGHHLSLWHTFSNTDSCTSETNCETQGDEVCDTPATLENGSCTSGVCEGANLENYMDYTDQECKNMFTEGQRTRMRACLESARSSLLESLGGVEVVDRDLSIAAITNLAETTCQPSIAPVVSVTNLGVETVEGFEITTTLNGHAPFTTVFQKTVAPGQFAEVVLPELALATHSNDIQLEVKMLGSEDDDYTANDMFNQTVGVEASDFWTFTFNTDQWADELAWRIEDENGEVLLEGGDYDNGANTYIESGCIPLGCHTLIIEDDGPADGNGMCAFDMNGDSICDVGGSFTLATSAGEVIATISVADSDFGSLFSQEVCATEVASTEGCDDANMNGICDDAEIQGCQDIDACNFTEGAILDDGSCTYPQAHYDCNGDCLEDSDGDGICDPDETDGCTDENACNFVPSASNNDGSCEYSSCAGCTNVNGCNYDPEATISSGCNFPEPNYDCDGNCLLDTDGDGICNANEIVGCIDSDACNYNANATDSGSCTYANGACEVCENGGVVNYDSDSDGVCDQDEVEGCQDAEACNFNVAATDPGTCTYPETHYDCDGNCLADTDGDGVCDALEIVGCTSQGAENYNPEATDDDGSCEFDDTGCMDPEACNYNPMATTDDGGCELSAEFYDCDDNCLNDADGDGVCDELEIPGCDDETACNYNDAATDNDGSCEYTEAFYNCDGSCMNDTDGDGVCDELETPGCNDDGACNYDTSATDDDGSCEYPEEYYDCDGNCENDLDGDGICDELEGDNVGDLNEAAALNLFPNPMSPEHSMVYLSGLDNNQAFIRVLATDGRVAWEGTGIVTSPGVVGYPIRESISPGTYFIQVGTSTPSGNIPLMVW
jgi:hypothetical protein